MEGRSRGRYSRNLKLDSFRSSACVVSPKNKTVVPTDASKLGLGCVCLQDSYKKYAQIEKELLAITFACDRFHYYMYGREFKVESDHLPL